MVCICWIIGASYIPHLIWLHSTVQHNWSPFHASYICLVVVYNFRSSIETYPWLPSIWTPIKQVLPGLFWNDNQLVSDKSSFSRMLSSNVMRSGRNICNLLAILLETVDSRMLHGFSCQATWLFTWIKIFWDLGKRCEIKWWERSHRKSSPPTLCFMIFLWMLFLLFNTFDFL